MNRLHTELQRLYLSPDAGRQAAGSEERGLNRPDGQVRAMVLELARPASWDGLAKVWQGVQADLELPAPAIAVSGIDGYQLWFSLAEPVPVAQAIAFLESLRRRYLGEVGRERIGMEPSDASAPGEAQHFRVPPAQGAPGRWSAFVASDLAGLFADEPWIDLPPSPDAQADLLSRFKSTKPEDWKRALEQLRPASTPELTPTPSSLDPRRFLLEIMNDRAVELHLRIEAAKALLPYSEGQRPV